MNRFVAVAALILPLFAVQGQAQVASTPGAAAPVAHDMAVLRIEVQALRKEVADMRQDVAEAREAYARLKGVQAGIYQQVETLAKTQTSKEEMLQQVRGQLESLNAQIQAAQTQVASLEASSKSLEQAVNQNLNRPAPAPPMAAAPQSTSSAAFPQLAALPPVDNQCGRLSAGDPSVWQASIPQILPGHVFEEVDRPNNRVWARLGGSSQGFVYEDVMRKMGCPTA